MLKRFISRVRDVAVDISLCWHGLRHVIDVDMCYMYGCDTSRVIVVPIFHYVAMVSFRLRCLQGARGNDVIIPVPLGVCVVDDKRNVVGETVEMIYKCFHLEELFFLHKKCQIQWNCRTFPVVEIFQLIFV